MTGHKFLIRLLWAVGIGGAVAALSFVWIGLGFLAALGALVLVSIVLGTVWWLGPEDDDPVLEEMIYRAKARREAGGFGARPRQPLSPRN